MAVLPRTAVVIVHGIGEQTPLATLRNFVGFGPNNPRGILEQDGEGEGSEDRRHVYVAPDALTGTTWARRISFDHTHRLRELAHDVPDLPPSVRYSRVTHFYEYYWAYRFRDTAWRHLTSIVRRLLMTPRADLLPGSLKGSDHRALKLIAAGVVMTISAALAAWAAYLGYQGHHYWIVPEAGAVLLLATAGLAAIQGAGLLSSLRFLAAGSLLVALSAVVSTALLASSSTGASSTWWSAPLATLMSLVLPTLSGRALLSLGDAARYLSNHPDNIQEREKVRAGLVRLLRDLEAARDPVNHRHLYDRVVLVGHSLGSVIAYDALLELWSEVNQQIPFPDRGAPAQEPMESAIRALEEWEEADGRATWEARQRRLQQVLKADVRWRDGKLYRSARRWIVSDLVTVGSPLAHGEVLLAEGADQLATAQQLRLLASNPPVPQTLEASASHPFRYRAWRGRTYCTKLHHRAVFAATTWTNIWFSNDLVGGPLQQRFGPGIRDVALETGSATIWSAIGRFTHTSYWGSSKAADNEPIRQSRRMLRDLAVRQAPVLLVSGSIARLKRFRPSVSHLSAGDGTDPSDTSPGFQLRALRVAASTSGARPKRDWTWLGVDQELPSVLLPEVLAAAREAGLVCSWSSMDVAVSDPDPTRAQDEQSDDDLDDLVEDLDPDAPEPAEE